MWKISYKTRQDESVAKHSKKQCLQNFSATVQEFKTEREENYVKNCIKMYALFHSELFEYTVYNININDLILKQNNSQTTQI